MICAADLRLTRDRKWAQLRIGTDDHEVAWRGEKIVFFTNSQYFLFIIFGYCGNIICPATKHQQNCKYFDDKNFELIIDEDLT